MGQEEPFSKAYFPSEALARDKPWPAMYLEGKVTMEPVFSTVRNWMFAEAQNLIDFGPYRPLVANPLVSAALHGSRKRSRRVLVDVGANGFFASPKYLLDSYEPFAAFTDAFMVEPEEHFKAEIPQSYKDRYNITHLQMYAEVNTGTPSDMLALLPSLVTKDDFVVLKFDVDPNRFAQVHAPCLTTQFPVSSPTCPSLIACIGLCSSPTPILPPLPVCTSITLTFTFPSRCSVRIVHQGANHGVGLSV
jgi:hypothetical protein